MTPITCNNKPTITIIPCACIAQNWYTGALQAPCKPRVVSHVSWVSLGGHWQANVRKAYAQLNKAMS